MQDRILHPIFFKFIYVKTSEQISPAAEIRIQSGKQKALAKPAGTAQENKMLFGQFISQCRLVNISKPFLNYLLKCLYTYRVPHCPSSISSCLGSFSVLRFLRFIKHRMIKVAVLIPTHMSYRRANQINTKSFFNPGYSFKGKVGTSFKQSRHVLLAAPHPLSQLLLRQAILFHTGLYLKSYHLRIFQPLFHTNHQFHKQM